MYTTASCDVSIGGSPGASSGPYWVATAERPKKLRPSTRASQSDWRRMLIGWMAKPSIFFFPSAQRRLKSLRLQPLNSRSRRSWDGQLVRRTGEGFCRSTVACWTLQENALLRVGLHDQAGQPASHLDRGPESAQKTMGSVFVST